MNSRLKSKAAPMVLLAVFAVVFFVGCKDDSRSTSQEEKADKVKQRRIPYGKGTFEKDDYKTADVRVLFIGNSHTSTCLMPKTVQQMLNARQSKKKIFCEICASSFLVDHLNRKRTTDLIQNGNWDLVVLQAQKYSMSGTVDYPYDAALALTRMAEQGGAKVLMYPEWGQRKKMDDADLEKCLDEAERVQKLHEKIVSESGATIAPVGLVWNEVLKKRPELKLHSDGNHANEAGAFLTATVFDQVIARDFLKLPPENLRAEFLVSDQYDVDLGLQKELAAIARAFLAGKESND